MLYTLIQTTFGAAETRHRLHEAKRGDLLATAFVDTPPQAATPTFTTQPTMVPTFPANPINHRSRCRGAVAVVQ